jgi:hypothetical protein
MLQLLSTLPLAAFGQTFYDYYSPDSAGKFGALQVVTPGAATSGANDNWGDESAGSSGHGGNKRYCHTTGAGRSVYNWTSNTNGGYYASGRQIVECIGEELYCFIEERAQFGQIIGITAGCEQMMNHPSVSIQDQQTGSSINAVKNNYNQEAARGGTGFHGLTSFYGIGGCLSMPAQNGHEYVSQDDLTSVADHEGKQDTGTDGPAWRDAKWNNYYRYFHGGFGQNQCLRFPKRSSGATINSPGNLLPFGVSVCRACCIAEFMAAAPTTATADTTAVFYHICNYPPALDATIVDRTNAANEEIVPRFDMQSVATNTFKDGSNNNLFVHEANCSGAGRARGCAVNGVDYVCDGSAAANSGENCP